MECGEVGVGEELVAGEAGDVGFWGVGEEAELLDAEPCVVLGEDLELGVEDVCGAVGDCGGGEVVDFGGIDAEEFEDSVEFCVGDGDAVVDGVEFFVGEVGADAFGGVEMCIGHGRCDAGHDSPPSFSD